MGRKRYPGFDSPTAAKNLAVSDGIELPTVKDHYEAIAEKFAQYLRDEAKHELTSTQGNRLYALREGRHAIENAGMDTKPDSDGTPRASAFAHPVFVSGLEDDTDDHLYSVPEDLGGVSVDGIEVNASAELRENEVVIIHHEAIVPTPVSGSWKPYLVKRPAGVAVVEYDEP